MKIKSLLNFCSACLAAHQRFYNSQMKQAHRVHGFAGVQSEESLKTSVIDSYPPLTALRWGCIRVRATRLPASPSLSSTLFNDW